MPLDIPAALAAMPDRLTALLFNEEDTMIDAEMQEAIDSTGLFAGLTGAELAKQSYYYRIGMLADEIHRLVAIADGSKAEREARITAELALTV